MVIGGTQISAQIAQDRDLDMAVLDIDKTAQK
jgi:hypothetical protein